MSFTSQLKRFADKAKKRPQQAQRAIFTELSRRIVMRTPVDTGRARANWQPSIDAPVAISLESFDKSGANALANAAATAVNVGPDQALYLTNNLPYIGRLEHGWSKQSPQGMVKLSALEFQQVTEVVVRGLNV